MGNSLENTYKHVNRPCRIVVVGPRNGDDSLLELRHLPDEARILATGSTLEELRKDGDLFSEANVLFNVSGNAETLGEIVPELPFLVWIHSVTAGVDHLHIPEILQNNDIVFTNARGIFGSALAEYALCACSYFAKNIPRLLQQQSSNNWNRFRVSELRGKTMGIVGYGDIGSCCAQLAKAYGMVVIAMRRNPHRSRNDPLINEVISFAFNI
jgi:phosphoglycerate dehydrogenase-like enzyme